MVFSDHPDWALQDIHVSISEVEGDLDSSDRICARIGGVLDSAEKVIMCDHVRFGRFVQIQMMAEEQNFSFNELEVLGYN